MPKSQEVKITRRFGTVADAAELLSCSTDTVRRLISDGTIKGYRLGKRMLRVDLDEVEGSLRQIAT